MARTVLPVKLAYESFDHLRKRAEEAVPGHLDRPINSVNKMLSMAELKMKSNDLEDAYILFLRSAMILESKLSSVAVEPFKSKSDVRDVLRRVMITLENLDCKLRSAYKEKSTLSKQESNVSSATDLKAKDITSAVTPRSNDPNPINSKDPQWIECGQLYTEMTRSDTNKGESNFFIFLDVRTSDSFAKSHIELEKHKGARINYCLINIPGQDVHQGLFASKIESLISPNKLDNFKKRKNARMVILLDWNSETLENNEKLKIVYQALAKYDQTDERLVRSPYILSGGYNEWLVNFGFLVTDANYKHASSEVYESRRLVNKVDNKLTTITTFYDSTQLNNKYNRLSISSPPKSSDAESKTYSAKTLLDSSNFMDNSFHKEFQGCGKTENKSGPRLPGYPVYAATGNTGGVNAVVPTTSLSKLASPILPEPAPKTHFIRNGRPEEDGSFKSPVAKDFARVKVDEIVSPDRTLKPMHLRNDLNKKNSYNDSIDALPTLNAPGFLNTNGASGGDLHALRKSSTEANSNRDALPPNIVDSADETDDQGSARYGRVRVMSRSHSFPNIADLVETGEDSVAGYSYPPNSFNAAELQHKPIFDRTVKPKYLPTDFESRASFSRDFAPVFRSKNETAMAPGLRNLGNTCFMNAVIQCLYNIHQFSSYFYNEEYKMDINRKTKFGTGGQLCEEFGELLKNMNIRQFKHISPADFKRVVGQHIPFMGGHDQQDSHEFLLILLEKLHADLNRAKVLDAPPKLPENMPKDQAIEEFWRAHVLRNRSIVSHLFEGLIASTLECQHCQSTSNTFEVFSCLSLPIPQNSGRCEISDCLEMFLKSELMSGDTAWDCPKCKQKRESIKKTSIVKLPKVLLIQLKRFSYEGRWKQKVGTFVNFPSDTLNLRHYASLQEGQPCYELLGIVNHFGTLEAGHYKANCKQVFRSGQRRWFKYDDQEVFEIDAKDVISQDAYILFYVSH